MRAPATPVLRRLTVLCPGRRVDVALPADIPLAELVPLVLELLGEPGPRARPDPWRFTAATGEVLPPAATLDELGVVDGEMLRIGPVAPPPPPPVFDDPVDALADLAAPTADRDTWLPAVTATVAAVAAAGLLVTGPPVWVNAGLGALAAAAALGLTARLARADHLAAADVPAQRRALVPVYCAVPLAAAAGWVAVSGPVDGRLLTAVVAAGCAAALGQVLVRAVAPVLVTATVVAVLVASALVTCLRFDVTVPAVAAVGAAVALAAGPLLPRVALRLGGLPRPVVPADAAGLVAADAGPDLLPADELTHRARTGRGLLSGLSGGCAVAAMIAVSPATAPGTWAGTALGAVVAATLLLRARGFADPGPARVHVCAGTVAAVSVVVQCAVTTAGRSTGALVLLGAAAAVVLVRSPTAPSPVVRRAVDVAEGVLTGATIPLALAAADVFALVRHL